jgi:hypothetical protein
MNLGVAVAEVSVHGRVMTMAEEEAGGRDQLKRHGWQWRRPMK